MASSLRTGVARLSAGGMRSIMAMAGRAAALHASKTVSRSFFTEAPRSEMGIRAGARWALPSGVSRGMASYPSHVALTFPALSPTMTAGTISKWMCKPGQKLVPGDHICDIETDKATIAWEAQEEGVVARMLVEEGTSEVPVGKVVLVLCDDAADVAAFASYVGNAAPATAAKAAPAAPAAAPKAAPAPPPAKAAGAGFLAAYKTKSWNFTSKYGLSSPQNQGS